MVSMLPPASLVIVAASASGTCFDHSAHDEATSEIGDEMLADSSSLPSGP